MFSHHRQVAITKLAEIIKSGNAKTEKEIEAFKQQISEMKDREQQQMLSECRDAEREDDLGREYRDAAREELRKSGEAGTTNRPRGKFYMGAECFDNITKALVTHLRQQQPKANARWK